MNIGETIRNFRLQKGMSQGDIEEKTGMLRCYTSRVENGHTIPSIETLAKYAQALEIPLYQLFYDGSDPKHVKGVELHRKDFSKRDWREIENLGRKFTKLEVISVGVLQVRPSSALRE